jgi:hypothetical protein
MRKKRMDKMKDKLYILYIVILLVALQGCVIPAQTETPGPTPLQPDTPPINIADDNTAKQLISDYFSTLFTIPSVDMYTENTRSGLIPDSVKQYIASQTIQEGDGNPEIPIHLPRYISLNGMTIISYDVVRLGEKAVPDISAKYIGKNGDNLLYFCKIIAKVKAVPDEIFLQSYVLQEDNTYEKSNDIPPEYIDGMRLEIRYDVEVEKSSDGMKILRAVESSIKPGLKNRLFIMNNDNITRLQYLDISKTPDGNVYINPADGEIYEAEKLLISSFFQNFTKLDRVRMDLMSHKWEQGLEAVKEYWTTLKITKAEEGSAEIVNLMEDYQQNYPYDSLPLRMNMERIRSMKNFVITPHPAYSENIKWYLVNFDATVQRTNGITDEDFEYRYDYLVALSSEEGTLIVQKIKLNEYYTIPKQ